MSILLQKVIEAIRTLSEEQLREVLDFIGYLKSKKSKVSYKTPSHPPSGKKLLEILQRERIIEELPDLSKKDELEQDSIPYTGKPASEIIIEDRGSK